MNTEDVVYIYIYTVEYYSVIKKDEIMPLAVTWRNLFLIALKFLGVCISTGQTISAKTRTFNKGFLLKEVFKIKSLKPEFVLSTN